MSLYECTKCKAPTDDHYCAACLVKCSECEEPTAWDDLVDGLCPSCRRYLKEEGLIS